MGKTYFFTATIHKWLPLLSSEKNKQLIIDYLKELSDRELVKVYSFVSRIAIGSPIMFISFGNNFKKMERKHLREVF